jgi:lysophospholipase L1-like esterase
MRVLVFGASITQGFWDTEGGWIARLRRYYDILKLSNIALEDNYPDIFNLGVSGDTTKDVLKRFEAETNARTLKGRKPMFIFSIGTNNTVVEGNGKKWSEPEEYQDDLRELITLAKKYSDKILFVGLPPCEEEKTTPVFWSNIHYTNERILLFDKAAREICEENGVAHVAIFEALKERMDREEKLFADGLHPNNKGHELICNLVRPELDKLVAS